MKNAIKLIGIRSFILAQLVILTSAAMEGIGIALVVPYITILMDDTKISNFKSYIKFLESFGVVTTTETIMAIGITTTVIIVAGSIVGYFATWMLAHIGQMSGYKIFMALLRREIELDYKVMKAKNSVSTIAEIIGQTDRINHGVLQPFLQLNSKIVYVIFISLILILIDWKVWLTMFFTIAIANLVFIEYTKTKLRTNANEIIAISQSRMKNMTEQFSLLKEIIINDKVEYWLEKIHNNVFNLGKYQAQNMTLTQLPRYTLESVLFTLVIWTSYYYSRNLSAGDLVPLFAAYGLAAVKLFPSIQIVFALTATVRSNINALECLSEVVQKKSPEEYNYVCRFDELLNVKIDKLHLFHEKDEDVGCRPILQNVNLDIRKNERIIIFGESGSGKSTLLDTILGLYMKDGVRLSVDGRPLSQGQLKAWHRLIGLVPQDVSLIDSTYIANIALGEYDNEVDMDRVNEAAASSAILRHINRLPNGMHTRTGEKGSQMSGGQRQRLGIARALYKKPQILVLDEATSALDEQTERQIIEELMSLKDVTILFVSHKRQLEKYFDRSIHLKNGEVVNV